MDAPITPLITSTVVAHANTALILNEKGNAKSDFISRKLDLTCACPVLSEPHATTSV